jgi:hypothetical protein
MNLDAWDFGLGVERRVTGNLWAALEAGWGGFRGLRISDHSVEEPDFEVGSSAYISLDFSFRPAVD